MKLRKKLSVFLPLSILFMVVVGSFYSFLLKEGQDTYQREASRVNTMVGNNPGFFESVFGDIFPSTINCQENKIECTKQARQKLDAISVSTKNYPVDDEPSNKHPMYFIKLLPDGKLAKLFFSGDLEIEEVNTREEKMVIDLLKGKRNELHGPYYDQELTGDGRTASHAFFDPKPTYLKDLYAQMEVIVPYYSDSQIIGATVYLHGE